MLDARDTILVRLCGLAGLTKGIGQRYRRHCRGWQDSLRLPLLCDPSCREAVPGALIVPLNAEPPLKPARDFALQSAATEERKRSARHQIERPDRCN